MPALHRLRVRNFRNLRDVELELGDLNVLVGPNGAGKSNLLAVLAFLGESVRRDLPQAVADAGGFDRLLFRGGRERTIEIGIHAQVTSYASATSLDEYTLRFKTLGRSVKPGRSPAPAKLERTERFKFKRTKGAGRRITVEGSKLLVEDENTREEGTLDQQALGLATLPKLGPRQGARQVAQIAELFSTFRVFEVDVRAARQPSALAHAERLDADAANLAAFLAYLESDYPDEFKELVRDLTRIVPGIKALHLVPIGGAGPGMSVQIEETRLRGRTWLTEASFGTIRVLALLAMLYDPHPPKLTCVEEIDHGLHPYALDLIVDRMRMASRSTQLIVATHSPTLVNRLAPRELIVCERDVGTGEALIPVIEPETVVNMEKALKGRLRLGELWFTGTLGGVPQ